MRIPALKSGTGILAVSGLALILAICLLSAGLAAQRVDPRNSHYRVWAIDRVVTNAEGMKVPAHANGKMGWMAIYNASGTLCLVEYTAKRYQDHDDVRGDRTLVDGPGPDEARRVRAFDKGKVNPQAIKAAAQAAGFNVEEVEKFLERSFVAVR